MAGNPCEGEEPNPAVREGSTTLGPGSRVQMVVRLLMDRADEMPRTMAPVQAERRLLSDPYDQIRGRACSDRPKGRSGRGPRSGQMVSGLPRFLCNASR